ncbi:glucose 1-dehydrogenase [Patulibacter minatonensis]|uniref:glucose 1-dehydrogenase n=1 Tax=Patulibacter minatonensis TaxID=298163 RepID=UPI0004B6428B|nr:glucose 1-dehydrogenase [Patulibacter minatonensis]
MTPPEGPPADDAAAPPEGVEAGGGDVPVAIVTGAARGIGAAIAGRLAADGVRVLVTDLDGEEAERTAARLTDEGHVALAASLDVADPEAFASVVRDGADELGPPTILVNNAGLTRSGFLHRMSDEDFGLVVDVVLRGSFNGMRAVAPWFRGEPRAGRRVVNVSSVAGVHGAPGGANYASAKAGVVGLTKAMAVEWAPYAVTVNAVAPGIIATRMLTDALSPEIYDALRAKVPIGRMGVPDDVAAAVAYLCSADAGYVTGQVLEIHGGLTDLSPPST